MCIMKKIIVTVISIMLSTGSFFSGCSEYEDELFDDSLDIKDNICRTRSISGDPEDDPNIKYAQNACGIWVIMSMIGSVNNNYYYAKVMDYAESIGWRENSGHGLTPEQIINICSLLKEDSEICGKNDIKNLPSHYSNSTNEIEDVLSEISKSYGKKKIQDVSIGVQVEMETIDSETGETETKLIDHWVVAEYINGNQIYVKNGYTNKYGTKKKFSFDDVRAIVY